MEKSGIGIRQTTIFRQLIFNVVFPAVGALLVLGVLNYQHTKNILIKANRNKNVIISDEIRNIHELQDFALEILQNDLNKRMELISNRLVNEFFVPTDNIETVDLYEIRDKLGMNPEFEDIYIINRNGVVVNTTFEQDKGLNFFDFGIEHKNLFLKIFDSGKYVSERFAIESKTRRLKKFTYQPTVDGKYIVELGIYSSKADEVIEVIKNRLNNIAEKQENIESIHLFIGADNPFSINANAQLDEKHLPRYRQVLRDKTNFHLEEKVGKRRLSYDYVYMLRRNTSLYSESVIRIISDRSSEIAVLRRELINFLLIFGMALIVVITLLYRKTRVITDPIKKLVQNVNRITDGHLNERAEVVGNNEITTLSEKFNSMIAQLESYYYELEEKVRQRTAEIEKQKEEIAAQRDSLEEQRNMLSEVNANLAQAYKEIEEQKRHIEDSIHYAKRIQNAILPPDEYVERLLSEYFILYKPKDIVSGDFYWVSNKEDKVFIAAVDCTGHGVPGAFMSIVGHDQLDYSVNVIGARKPSDILNALNQGVTDTLRQKRTEISVKDGMDIALCALDFKKKTLEFAGAYNPLFHVRNSELIQVPADKFPVGAFLGEDLSKFTNHEINLNKGDIIYIFSDGYADQFGGPKNKKFLTKRFREMLMDIHNQPMERQQEILDATIEGWRGSNNQIDDILVIGIKI